MAKHRHKSRKHNPFRKRVHNPFSVKGISHAIVPAAIGGAGGVALDIALAYIPLPAALQTGWGNTLAKVAGAFGLGWLSSKVLGAEKAKWVTFGALTIPLYQAIRSLAQQTIGANVKGLSGLADFRDYSMGAYMKPALGAYMNPGAMIRPGNVLPASTVRTNIAQRQMGAYMRGSRVGGAFASGY